MRTSKFLKIFFVFIITVLTLSVISLFKVDASSNIQLVNGAQIRTTGNEGIKFIVNSADVSDYTEYGFICAKGTYTFDELKDAFEVANTNASWSTLSQGYEGSYGYKRAKENSIVLINAYKENPTTGSASLVIYNINEESYLTDLSVFVYGKTETGYEYSECSVSRNVAEIALNAKNKGTASTLINNITSYLSTNYKKVGFNENGNYEIGDMNEIDPATLEVLFVEDWNAKFDTTFTEMVGTSFQTSASTGLSTRSESDATVSNLYKFFNDEVYGPKWQWLLEFLLTKADIHPRRQINALLSENGTYTDEYGSSLNLFYHLNYSICNFFNGAADTAGFAPINFTDPAKYDGLSKYSEIYAELGNFEIVKIGETITLPDEVEKLAYDWKCFVANETEYAANSEYVVTDDSVVFEPTYTPTVYTIKFMDGEEILEDLTIDYTIESEEIELPEYYEVGYYPEYWYLDADCIVEAKDYVSEGSYGDKVFYVKQTETDYIRADVTFDFNGGIVNNDFVSVYCDELISFNLTRYLTRNTGGYEASLLNDTKTVIYWSFICLDAVEGNTNLYEIVTAGDEDGTATTHGCDYIIAWHASLTDTRTLKILNNIQENIGTYEGMYIYFENIPDASSTACNIECYVYDPSYYTDDCITKIILPTNLPTPVNGDLQFLGWENSLDGKLYDSYPGYKEEGVELTLTAQWFDETNLTKFAVDDDYDSLDQGTIVTLNGNHYVVGKNAFPSIAAALEVCPENGTIDVASGTYTEALSITKSGITLLGANANVAGYDAGRAEETVLNDVVITLSKELSDVTINGFNMTGTTSVNDSVATVGTEDAIETNLENFALLYNKVEINSDYRIINFVATRYSYNNNTTIQYNYFTQNTTGVNAEDQAEDQMAFRNERNINISYNTFENMVSNPVWFDDRNKGFSGTDVNICYNTFKEIAADAIYIDWLSPDYQSTSSVYNFNNNTFENITGNAIYIERIQLNTSVDGVRINMENNTFKGLTGSALYVAKTTADITTALNVNIYKNLFEDVDGGACLDFEAGSSTTMTSSYFMVHQNTFKDVWKGLWVGHIDGVKFTNNVYYKYAGSLSSTSAYVCRGSVAGPIDANQNLYLSTDGATVYTTPSTEFVFNGDYTTVNNIDSNNYISLEAYQEAIASLTE